MQADKVYLGLLQDVLENGELISNGRTKEAYYSVFGRQVRYNLREGFPLLTTKKIFWKGVVHELLWFLSGSTNVKYLQDNGVKIWNDWVTPEYIKSFGRGEGDLGPVYGHQWRNFGGTEIMVEEIVQNQNRMLNRYLPTGKWQKDGVDQLNRLIELIKNSPNSRRLIVTGWNPQECDAVALPPCHTLFQFNVSHKNSRLNCHLYSRSCDLFLGAPFNIATYSLLTHMIAQICNLEVGEFVHSISDAHIYENHLDQVKEQLSREILVSPQLLLDPSIKNIDDFKFEHIKIMNYEPHGAIKAPVAV